MSNRSYSSAFNDGKAAPAFSYIYDPTWVTTGVGGQLSTGAYRPYATTDISNTSVNVSGLSLSISAVSITGNPQVQVSNFPAITPTSGIVTINSIPTHNITVTGGQIQTIVTGTVNSTITGFNSTIAPHPITGLVGITNTTPIAISGIVQTVVTGNIGGNVTVNSVAITGAPVVTITGVVATTASVTVGNVTITGFNSTIAPLAVSGSFSATIGNVNITGNGTVDPIVRGLLSGISGTLVSNLTDAAWVTGQVSLTNLGSAPLNVTGIVQTVVTGSVSSLITNPIGVTGTISDNNVAYNNGTQYKFLPIGGRAVAATGAGAATGYSSGNFAILNINQTNGALFVNQGVLDYTQDTVSTVISGSNPLMGPIPISGIVTTSTTIGNVAITGFTSTIAPLAVSGAFNASISSVAITGFNSTIAPLAVSGIISLSSTITSQITGFNTGIIVSVQPNFKSSVSNSMPSGVAPFTAMNGVTGTALNVNPNRVMFFIQNIHTGLPLYVLFGSSTPGTGNFNMILNPSINLGYGGDSFTDDHYRGQINVSGGAWNAWEV